MFQAVVLPLALAGALAGGQSPAALNVSAAASLVEALEQASALYRRGGGAVVRLNLGGSSALARQMISGAPVDVFISADQAQMDAVERSGALAPGTRVDLLSNQLAILATPQYASRITGPRTLADPAIRRIAIGEPSAVPAGVYARRYLERVGLWDAIKAKLIPTSSVRSALAAVDSGAADAAIVYVTDAAVARSARIAYTVPAADAPPIVYAAAVGARAPNRDEALRFLAFLRGAEAAAIFRARGFLPVPPR